MFEKDPVKYSEYHKAMYAALKDRLTDEDAAKGKVVNLMVLGAGRGPLVRAALKAGEQVCSSRLVFQMLTSKFIFSSPVFLCSDSAYESLAHEIQSQETCCT